jgi:hypothetical protein
MTRPWAVPGAVAFMILMLTAACGAEPAGDQYPTSPAAPQSPPATGSASGGGSTGGSEGLPDEQVLCGAVDEVPIAAALGEPIEIRAFHGPSGAGRNVSCNWETITKSVTVLFYEWPSFRTLIDDDIFDEYGQGEFNGLGVEAHRNVYRGLLADSPRGWAVELRIVGTIVPSDEELTAIALAALAAADTV